jgi:hypothetical protein
MRTVTDEERRARIGVRHGLAVPAAGVEQATRAVTCLHATEPASLYLSAFARSGACRDDVGKALYGERIVVRQLAMRRTVFAFPRDLLPAVRGSASARVAAQLAARLAKDIAAAGITRDGAAWLTAACAQAFAALREEPSTTAQLRARLPELNRRVPAEGRNGADAPVGPRVLTVLAAGGTVVRGINDGGWGVSRPVWTPVKDWLGADPGALDEAAGYAELTRRWLWSHGPGTEADLVWWLGATKTAARRALADVGAAEVRLEDGSRAWLHPGDTGEVTAREPWAALLPALDPATMGWQGRGFYLGDHARRIFDRNGNGGPTAWWNGRIVGGWTQDENGTVIVVPVGPLPPGAGEALACRAGELAAWLDGDIVRSNFQAPLVRARDARANPVRSASPSTRSRNLTCGEGGALVPRGPAEAERARSIRDLGITQSRDQRSAAAR